MPKHLTGRKITSSHTSIIAAALNPVSAAHKLPEVKKIVLGIIQSIPTGEPRLKYSDLGPTCFVCKIRGTRSIQEIYVYVNNNADKDLVRQIMDLAFQS